MAVDRVKVTITEDGEPSGLAMMMLQYFEQNINGFEDNGQSCDRSGGGRCQYYAVL